MRKICVITGATSGIGLATATQLSTQETELILIARNESKLKNVVENLQKHSGNQKIAGYQIDLSSQGALRQAGLVIRATYPVIDVLINNAGVVTSKHERTEDGIEMQFAVNHLAYFLLTHLLYPCLAQSKDGRIINIGSDSHWFGKIHFDNINLENGYHPLKAYAQSKLANLLFTYELDRIKAEHNISVNCVQPGLVKTDIGIKHTNLLHAVVWRFRRLLGKTPEKAAKAIVCLATDPRVTESGLYWQNGNIKESSPQSKNREDAQQLWQMSETMCGIVSYFNAQ